MSDLQRYLVVGSGSIARRHIANLKQLFPDSIVSCISASGRPLLAAEVGADIIYQSLAQAMENPYQFAIVATPAPFHVRQAAALLHGGVPVMIEKPLADSMATFEAAGDMLLANKHKIDVAYNLRFMPSAIRIKALLDERVLGKIYSVLIDVGQFLPDWRPTTDYRKNVSAQKKLGGGVLLELSHELDYLAWLFGNFESVFCITANSGALDIDVEDTVDAILRRKDGLIATLHMDFLQRAPSRTCKIIGESGTLIWNLLSNSISLHTSQDSEKVLFSDPHYNRNVMYMDELSRFSKVATGELSPAVGIDQALYTLRLVEALKKSSVMRQAVTIGDFDS